MASAVLLSSFDVNDIAPEALLFQTGYLTIAEEETRGRRTRHRLGHPNREVREGLNECLLRHLMRDASRQAARLNRVDVGLMLDATFCLWTPPAIGPLCQAIRPNPRTPAVGRLTSSTVHLGPTEDYRAVLRSRRAFVMTETELALMAALASIGERRTPSTG